MNKQNIDPFFNQLAGARPVKLLGSDATATTKCNSEWATAMVYRGDESNIAVNQQQIPPGVTLNQVKRGNRMFIQGYSPFSANQKTFCFTTFHTGEMPHLLSDHYFEQNRPTRAS